MASDNGRDSIRLTTAQAVVKYLSTQYSERDGEKRRLIAGMFGIFGHGNVAGLGQALCEYGVDLPYYQPCNEQSMVHTASGYARANLRLATLACTSSIGPGATNMVTGAATATINRMPVLLLPSDYYATRHQGPVLQQLEHPVSADTSVNDCLRPVSRFFDRITRPEQLLTALPEAMRVLLDPADTGAVTISLPQDVQAHAYDYPVSFFEPRTWQVERRKPDASRIEEALELLKKSRRPLIIAGGGVHYSAAWTQLGQFSKQCGIPVGETFAGRGAMREDSPMVIGGHGVTGAPVAARLAAEADLIISVGTRLTDFTTSSQSMFQHPDVNFVNINVAAKDAYKQGAVPVTADAREALTALSTAAANAGLGPDLEYVAQVAKLKEDWGCQLEREALDPIPGEVMNQGQLIRVMNEEAQPGDTIVAAAGGPPGDLHKMWDATGERHCHLEFGYSCMGYEIPAGIGVRMTQSEGEVIVYIGDGTYLMNPMELVTAVQENQKITVVVANNHGYQVIRLLQMGRAGRSFGNEFRSRDVSANRLEGDYLEIDYAANAGSMGARTWNVSTPEEARHALREARSEPGTCLIVAEVEKHRYLPAAGTFWDIAAAEVSGDEVTQKLRNEYDEGRSQQKFYY